MSIHRKYAPILKWRAGEMSALHTLSYAQKDAVFPVIEVVDAGEPSKILDELAEILADIPVYLDTSYSDDDGTTLLMELINKSRAYHLESYPVLSFDNFLDLSDRLQGVTERILLRVPVPEDIDGDGYDEIFDQASTWSKEIGIQVDVMLDLGYMADKSEANSRFFELKSVLRSHFLQDTQFGTIIIASTSCPTDLGTLAAGESISIDRYEFKIFNKIYTTPEFEELKNRLVLSDYGVTRFTDSEIDFTKLRYGILPKARYTLEDKYWIIKGKRDSATKKLTKGHKEIAEEIYGSPNYYGESFSFGDEEIKAIATTSRGPGNNTNWVTITASHHIAVSIGQLSSLV